jgi:hypothetical protein
MSLISVVVVVVELVVDVAFKVNLFNFSPVLSIMGALLSP